jgi:Ca2+-binding RTX toxin-like protein
MKRKVAVVATVVVAAFPSSAVGATVSLNEFGALIYEATPGELNDVELSKSAGTFTITDAGALITAGPGCDQVSEHEATCTPTIERVDIHLGDLADTAASQVGPSPTGIFVFGDGGDDVLTLCSLCNNGVLFGNAGADTLQGGDVGAGFYGGHGPDTLTGGASYDDVHAGPGNDTIDTGGGEDTIVPGDGDDFVDGGSGRDRLFFNPRGPGVAVDLGFEEGSGQGTKALLGIEDVIGTNHQDWIEGDAAWNRFNGLGGDDVLVGGRGSDRLCGCGGRGSDHLFGGPGSDDLSGGDGADRLVGGTAGDVLRPGEGQDHVFGFGGDDEFYSRDGFRDVLRGGRGRDSGHVDRGIDGTTSIETFF